MKKIKDTVKKTKEVKFLKGLYGDFKSTMGSVFGDASDVWAKHKLLVIVAFIAYLLFRNKQFSIGQFVSKLEERLKGDREW